MHGLKCSLQLSIRNAIMIRKFKQEKARKRPIFVRVVFFIVAFDDDLSPVRSAMCDIVLLSAVKKSIHLEEEQATIINIKKKRIEKQSKSIFLPVFLGFSMFFFPFTSQKKGRVSKRQRERELSSSI